MPQPRGYFRDLISRDRRSEPTPESAQRILDDVETDLDLLDEPLRGWSRQYLANHRRRYLNDLETVRQHYRSGEILEIGSLPYHLTACLKGLGYPITGVDLEPDRAQAFIGKHDLAVVKCDIEAQELPFEDGRFALVLFCEIFEHLRIDPIFTLSEINRVTAPKGTLILTTPNLFSTGNVLRFLSGHPVNDVYEEFSKLQVLGHMGHVREYATSEVVRFLGKCGFRTAAVKYKDYGPPVQVLTERFGPTRARLLGAFLQASYLILPKARPYQVLVCRKASPPQHLSTP